MYTSAEEILKELRDSYQQMEKSYLGSNVEEIKKLQLNLLQLSELVVSTYDYELDNGTDIIGKVKRIIKKCIRKSVRFILKPYAEKMLTYQNKNGILHGGIITLLMQYSDNLQELEIKIEGLNSNYKRERYLRKKLSKDVKNSLENNSKNSMEIENIKNMIMKQQEQQTSINLKSYSQAGEDQIVSFLLKYLGTEKKGFTYLDIGCNHYRNLNNTFAFYERGFRGVLVEANPAFLPELQRYRPEDTILNFGVSPENGKEMAFYILNGDGLSSFNKASVDESIKRNPQLKIEQEIVVPTISVDAIIEKYFHVCPTLVSIDVEGVELDILRSIDMNKHRPLIYIIETIDYRVKLDLDNKNNEIVSYMEKNNYKEYAFSGVNSIFIDRLSYRNY